MQVYPGSSSYQWPAQNWHKRHQRTPVTANAFPTFNGLKQMHYHRQGCMRARASEAYQSICSGQQEAGGNNAHTKALTCTHMSHYEGGAYRKQCTSQHKNERAEPRENKGSRTPWATSQQHPSSDCTQSQKRHLPLAVQAATQAQLLLYSKSSKQGAHKAHAGLSAKGTTSSSRRNQSHLSPSL